MSASVGQDYAEIDKTDLDLDATNGRVPDAPAPSKMEKNVVINNREEHSPPPAEVQGGGDTCKYMATEVPKTVNDLGHTV